MLNYIWLALIALAVLIGGLRGQIGTVGQAAIDGASTALTVAWGLIAVMTLWLGLMRLADKAGLVHRLGLALKPVMKWLFPEVPADHPAMGAIILNVAANILGLNNAATPLGLRAMNQLESLNKRPGVATNAMCMLLAINTSSITLIPVTVIALLALSHGKNPTVVIGSSLLATAIAHAAAILTCKALEKSRFYRLPPPSEKTFPETPVEKEDLRDPQPSAGKQIEEETTRRDVSLPWVRHSNWILTVIGAILLTMLLITAFPEILGRNEILPAPFSAFLGRMDTAWHFFMSSPGVGLRVFALRLLNGISILAIPVLIFFFPFYAMLRRIPVYEEFVEGGKEGFHVIIRILPYIVGMLVAVSMFNASGGMLLLTWMLQPITHLFGFPAELVPLALIRPFSGAASLPILANIIHHYGPDSFLALTAGTMYGCSETTFYVIAVYFGSVGIRKTRHAIPAGLVADVVGPLAAVMIGRMMFH